MTNLSTGDVLDRHLNAFAAYDLGGVIADYAPDAVLFSPAGPLKGPAAIKPLFEGLMSEFAKPGSCFQMQQKWIDGDHAHIVWNAETADNSYEFATDTFVVRNGKIVAQSFAAKVRPKR
jgi:ketosteroid isomerase-like protein